MNAAEKARLLLRYTQSPHALTRFKLLSIRFDEGYVWDWDTEQRTRSAFKRGAFVPGVIPSTPPVQHPPELDEIRVLVVDDGFPSFGIRELLRKFS